jgi:RNA polymerase sigma-70 factor (ECF subfamily)
VAARDRSERTAHLFRDRRTSARAATAAEEAAENLPEREEFDREFRRAVLGWAAERVRGEFSEDAWRSFRLTTLEEKSLQEAGKELCLSAGTVALGTDEVLARVKEVIESERIE